MNGAERHSSETGDRQYRFGGFVLDLGRGFLCRGDDEIPLRPKSFEVLTYLVERNGRLVPKEELIQAVWPDAAITDNSLAQCLVEIRRALSDDSQQVIRTVARRGYMFTGSVQSPVAVLHGPPAAPEGAFRGARTKDRRVRAAVIALAVLLLVLGAFAVNNAVRHADLPETLAVLPFKPMGTQSQDEYLQLGMTDALITKLSNVARLVVRPTSAVRKYAASQDAAAAGRELRVRAVVDGTVQKLGQRIRVSVQVLRVSDGRPMWAGNFDQSSDDIFAVQDSISGRIAAALVRNLTGAEAQRLNEHYTGSVEAYELYVKGRYCWQQRSKSSLEQAVTYFEAAIRKDPRYALAYAGLAQCYGPLMQLGYMPAIEALPKMEAAASKAVEIDDMLSDAHTALAAARTNEWDWPNTEREFKRAIELNPNDATAHMWYGFYLNAMGRWQENLVEARRAYELDPSNLTVNAGVGLVLFLAGHRDDGIALLQKAIQLNPDFRMAHNNLGWMYTEMGQFVKALEQVGPEDYGTRAYVLARAGDPGAARRNLERFLAIPQAQRPGSEVEIAAIYASLGDPEEAFSWLERAYRERAPKLMFLKVNTGFASLRKDPRFHDLLSRVRLL